MKEPSSREDDVQTVRMTLRAMCTCSAEAGNERAFADAKEALAAFSRVVAATEAPAAPSPCAQETILDRDARAALAWLLGHPKPQGMAATVAATAWHIADAMQAERARRAKAAQ